MLSNIRARLNNRQHQNLINGDATDYIGKLFLGKLPVAFDGLLYGIENGLLRVDSIHSLNIYIFN